jgi:hypothetical protein
LLWRRLCALARNIGEVGAAMLRDFSAQDGGLN